MLELASSLAYPNIYYRTIKHKDRQAKLACLSLWGPHWQMEYFRLQTN